MSNRLTVAPATWRTSQSLDAFATDVRKGLGLPRKQLNCKYFYDQRGAALFERICELEEYYLTRTELQIMQRHVAQMANAIGRRAVLIELGSGSAIKTRMVLDHLPEPAGYVPVDIAGEQLSVVSQAIARDYPHLEVSPVCADFTAPFALPTLSSRRDRRLVYFPGSTVGNFDPRHATAFLAQLRRTIGADAGLLIGIDLKKDPAVLHAAYNDAAGITAEFNLNVLHRINRELEGTFDTDLFAHYAFYNPARGRVEMHLVSREHQLASAAGERFAFRMGESIFTESSYKHEPHEFARLARQAGFELTQMWTDERRWFAVQLYRAR